MRGIRSKTLMHAYDKDTGVLDENKQRGLGYKIIGPIRNSGITFDYGMKETLEIQFENSCFISMSLGV
jgi:hypothetical protein